MQEFNIGASIAFDYKAVDGKESFDRRATIESVKAFDNTNLIVCKTGETDGKTNYRTFYQNRMMNVRVV